MRSPVILSLPLLAAVASAHAGPIATLTVSQDFESAGDVALGDTNANVALPTWDATLGPLQSVTVSINGTMDWSVPLTYTMTAPGADIAVESLINTPTSSIEISTSRVSGTPWFNPCAAATCSSGFDGFQETDAFSGTLTTSAAAYDPELLLEPSVAAFCDAGCLDQATDDAFGRFLGTAAVTFTYIDPPAQGLPEPPAGAPLIAGVLALWLARCVKRITKF